MGNMQTKRCHIGVTTERAARIAAVLALWLLAVGMGFAALTRHEVTPGLQAAAGARWPGDVPELKREDRLTLVMAAHPRCPCTRASLHELTELIEKTACAPRVLILCFTPGGGGDEWSNTPIAELVRSIPGVEIIRDGDGALAARFGAKTSGQVLLYSPSGELVFEGGITAARGHTGENAGSTAVAELLRGKSPAVHRTPVYGCELLAPGGACAAEKGCER
jgi:hypothetical protein